MIVGGGFAGLDAARGFAGADVRVTLLDRHNYHLFQPLLYQVATAALSPGDIASPIRWILRKQKNVQVLLADVRSIDAPRHVVVTDRGEIELRLSDCCDPAPPIPTSVIRNGPLARRASKRWTMRSRFGGACCWPTRRLNVNPMPTSAAGS